MSDTDSELGFFPTVVRKMRRRSSVVKARAEQDSDEESLYETMPQKLHKMNKKKRIVRKGGLTNVTYKVELSRKFRKSFRLIKSKSTKNITLVVGSLRC